MALGAVLLAAVAVGIAGGGNGHTSRGVDAFLVVFLSAAVLGGWRIWQASSTGASSRGSSQLGDPARAARRIASSTGESSRGSSQRVPSEITELDVELRILAAATQCEGRVTVGEVALACRIPIARAKETLERMVSAGTAELLLTDGGDTVYRIAGLLPAAEKEAAMDPLADVLPQADRRRR
jgi:hypothetical protein